MEHVTSERVPFCPACEGEMGEVISLREMMFGTRESFAYGVCSACGSARILVVPTDLARHYPADYLSFTEPPRAGRLRGWLKTRRASHVLGRPNLFGALALRASGSADYLAWCTRAGVRQDDRVLDVGCGRGHLLLQMHEGGFRNLTGIDPFLEADSALASDVQLFRRNLADTEGTFDFVMMHHSLEHVPDPREALRHVRRLLAADGRALIRVPVAGRYAGRTYGADWVQWDAPRHLFVPTLAGMERLVASAELTVSEVVFDSTGLQFWGSEMYRRGLPLSERDRHLAAGDDSVFTRDQLRDYEAQAAALNRAGDGDQACFYLRVA
jgi:SAM-dependent methyltransferase